MARGADRARRRERAGRVLTMPLALVAFGAFAVAVGVAVPFHAVAVAIGEVAAGGVEIAPVPLVVGLALCSGGFVTLVYGLLLLIFE